MFDAVLTNKKRLFCKLINPSLIWNIKQYKDRIKGGHYQVCLISYHNCIFKKKFFNGSALMLSREAFK